VGGRPQLDDRVVALALDAAGAHDDPRVLEREVRRVEEVHEADLRVERIETERLDGGALLTRVDAQLELDAVGLVHELEELDELLLREEGCRGGDGVAHAPSIPALEGAANHPQGVNSRLG
jgi:hypothetical protein